MASGVVAVLIAACSALASVKGVQTGCAAALIRQMLAEPAVQLGTSGIVTVVFKLPSPAVLTVASCLAPRLRPAEVFMLDRLTQADTFGLSPWALTAIVAPA